MLHAKYADLVHLSAEKAHTYQNNAPFPNICFDNFFNPIFLRKVKQEFPEIKKLKNKIYYKNPNEDKYATSGEYTFGPRTKELVHYLNSQPFLEFLQKLTGIEETLIPDPYFDGGGFHEIKPGGFLKVHVDFHKHKKLHLSRRINLLVYLNEEWEESYGGHFELWERDMSKASVRILPIFNRVAIFTTTGDSWHGHPDPLTCPEGRSRRSLALYYYTNGRPKGELKQADERRITTTFASRKGKDSLKMKQYNNTVNLLNKVLPQGLIERIKRYRNK